MLQLTRLVKKYMYKIENEILIAKPILGKDMMVVHTADDEVKRANSGKQIIRIW